MRRHLRHALLCSCSLALAGCATSSGSSATEVTLTRVGEAVEVTDNMTSVQECEFITDVPFDGGTGENAMRALRNDTGRLGANTVLLVMSGGSVTRAEGYLCGD